METKRWRDREIKETEKYRQREGDQKMARQRDLDKKM
jgi:hypothetical protein